MVKVVYWRYYVFPIRNKKYLILQFLRTRISVAISGNNCIIKNPIWMKEQAEAYQKGENLLTYGLKEWYPQIRPIVGNFCQIEQDLTRYYQYFQTYYQENPQNDWQKLYPPAFYQQYFLKNMVK